MYRVKFWNPERKPGSGFIESYHRAAKAKAAVLAYNTLYEKLGHGLRAEYLGKR